MAIGPSHAQKKAHRGADPEHLATAEPASRPSPGGYASPVSAAAFPALQVGSTGDPYEQAADTSATRAVERLRVLDLLRGEGSGQVRRSTGHTGAGTVGAEGGLLGSTGSATVDALRGTGQPLLAPVRRAMETALGADLGAVRVHEGAQARELSDTMQASAFTVGKDVFFRDGLPDLATDAGRHLLAHELTHTTQPGGVAHRGGVVSAQPAAAAGPVATAAPGTRQPPTPEQTEALLNAINQLDALSSTSTSLPVDPAWKRRQRALAKKVRTGREKDSLSLERYEPLLTEFAALRTLFNATVPADGVKVPAGPAGAGTVAAASPEEEKPLPAAEDAVGVPELAEPAEGKKAEDTTSAAAPVTDLAALVAVDRIALTQQQITAVLTAKHFTSGDGVKVAALLQAKNIVVTAAQAAELLGAGTIGDALALLRSKRSPLAVPQAVKVLASEHFTSGDGPAAVQILKRTSPIVKPWEFVNLAALWKVSDLDVLLDPSRGGQTPTVLLARKKITYFTGQICSAPAFLPAGTTLATIQASSGPVYAGAAPEGGKHYGGNRPWGNNLAEGNDMLLPTVGGDGVTLMTYTEYDTKPYSHLRSRGPQRVLVGNDGRAWYTADHYKTSALFT